MIWLVLLLLQAAAPPQAERGQALFFDKAACGTCHALKGRGTAVGPDLKGVGRIPPRAIAMSIRATRTQYVQNVKLKTGEPFPAMKASEDDKTIQLFDLSATPPVAKKVEKTEIEYMRDNDTWKHPPASAELTNEQMADIVAFIRWAATGERRTIEPSEVQ